MMQMQSVEITLQANFKGTEHMIDEKHPVPPSEWEKQVSRWCWGLVPLVGQVPTCVAVCDI